LVSSFSRRVDVVLENLALRRQLLALHAQLSTDCPAQTVLGCVESVLVWVEAASRFGHSWNRRELASSGISFVLDVGGRVGPRNVTASLSQVGSRADAMLLRSDLSVAPRFLWECLTNRIVSWVSAPAASNVACGFPALRSPVCFSSRVMRPIVLGQLSGEMRFGELDSR
jgi:hypothetical protein